MRGALIGRVAPWLVLVLLAPAVAAHGGLGSGAIETRFQTPPWVAWATGALVVALTYLVVAAFLTRSDEGAGRPLAEAAPHAGPGPGLRRLLARALGVVMLALVLPSAFGGPALLPPLAVWFLLGSLLPILAYTLGNPWPWVSPFRALAPLAERLRGGRAPLAYPARAGAWPSVLLLVALIGLEPRLGTAQDAATIARLAAVYTAFTLAGIALFGASSWLRHAEVFERVFHWWSSLAPRRGQRWTAGPAGLAHARAADVAFTLALLYAVNFDGFLATAAGDALWRALHARVGEAGYVALLLGGYALFAAAFTACAFAIRRYAASLEPLGRVAARFAPSLVPIAAGYHAAHNVFHVAENAPLLLHALDDPWGRGASLLGVPDGLGWRLPADLGPFFASTQMLLIVVGHVGAVLVAHRLATAGFPSRVQALRGELPLTLVMVFYTLVGLWIVSAAAGGVA